MGVGGKPEKHCWCLVFGLAYSEIRGFFGVKGGGRNFDLCSLENSCQTVRSDQKKLSAYLNKKIKCDLKKRLGRASADDVRPRVPEPNHASFLCKGTLETALARLACVHKCSA